MKEKEGEKTDVHDSDWPPLWLL